MPDNITCASCGNDCTERPRHFRQKDYCSQACIQKAIDERNQRVSEAAAKKEAAEIEHL